MPGAAEESINRGNVPLAVGYLAATSVGPPDLAFGENESPDKADDLLIVLPALIGMAWYTWGRHRHQPSLVPPALVEASCLIMAGSPLRQIRRGGHC